MEYINDININEAIIHVLDSNAEALVLNEYALELNEETYVFLYKHLEKCLKDDELKYAKFNEGTNLVRDNVKPFLDGEETNLIEISKKLARQLFAVMHMNENVPSADLLVASIITDQGPMIAIIKMDYVKNFTHEVNFIDEKIGIGIAGLPGSGQKVQKAAFIKPSREGERYNIMLLDKRKATRKDDEYSEDYFLKAFLGASTVVNERDYTREFMTASENFIRRSITDNAAESERVRTAIKDKLESDDAIDLEKFAEELFPREPVVKEAYLTDLRMKAIDEEIPVDKQYVDKKLKRVRLNIDKHIDLYIDKDTYKDKQKFVVKNNGDGSVDMIIKNVYNYIEK